MNQIFDRKLLEQNQARAQKTLANHSFLYHEIANRIVENLQIISRDFEDVLEIGKRDDFLQSLITSSKAVKQYSAVKDTEDLSFVNQKFDLIISNLNLHHINLVLEFLLQSYALLKPGGIFIASFFGQENLKELHKTIFEVENEIYGGISPRMIPTIDIKTAAGLLQKTNFHNSISSLENISALYSSAIDLLKDIKRMGQGNVLTKRSRKFFTKTFLNKLCEKYEENYQNEHGLTQATFEVVIVSGFRKDN